MIENESVQCDIAMIPIGGTYTMDVKEAASFINKIVPKVVVPTHYKTNGNPSIISNFKQYVNEDIDVNVLLK